MASATGQTRLTKSALCKEGAPGGLPLAQTHGFPRPGLGWAGGTTEPPSLCPTAQPHAVVCPSSCHALRDTQTSPGRDAPCAGCRAGSITEGRGRGGC